jgi:hypothetical protein
MVWCIDIHIQSAEGLKNHHSPDRHAGLGGSPLALKKILNALISSKRNGILTEVAIGS